MASSYHGRHGSLEHFPHHRNFYWIEAIFPTALYFHLSVCYMHFKPSILQAGLIIFLSNFLFLSQAPCPHLSSHLNQKSQPAPNSSLSFFLSVSSARSIQAPSFASLSSPFPSSPSHSLSSKPYCLSLGLCLWHPS